MERVINLRSCGKHFIPKTSNALYLDRFHKDIEQQKKRTPDWERRVLPVPTDEEHSKKYLIELVSHTGEPFLHEAYYIKHSRNYIIDRLNERLMVKYDYYNGKKPFPTWTDKTIESARKFLDGWYDSGELMLRREMIADVFESEAV